MPGDSFVVDADLDYSHRDGAIATSRWDYQVADDIHRVADDPMVAIGLGYWTRSNVGLIDLEVFIYRNDERNGPKPGDDTLLWNRVFHDLPTGNNSYSYQVLLLPENLSLPAHLWIGFRARMPVTDSFSLLYPQDPNRFGWTDWGGRCQFPEESGLVWIAHRNEGIDLSAMIEVYSKEGALPAPGCVAVLAAGFAARRRR